MRVLSLITHYSSVPGWESHTTRIDYVDPQWTRRNRLSKGLALLRLAGTWDRILFFYDTRLPLIFWVLYVLRFWANPRERMIFATFLCDVSRLQKPTHRFGGIYETLRRLYFAMFTRVFHTIVVHSRAEIDLYARSFGVPRERFRFIPYCVRRDALGEDELTVPAPFDYVLVAGRNRDYGTFISALEGSALRGVIIGGNADREAIGDNLPANVESHLEVPFDEYRSWIAGAQVFVVPIPAKGMTRSLGQISSFEAMARRVPVVAARTFQLEDYFSDEQEILFYEPGNASDLQRQIKRLLADKNLRDSLIQRAHARLMAKYTDEQYTAALLELCLN